MKLKKLNSEVCGWLPYQTFVFPCDWNKCTKWFKAWCNSRWAFMKMPSNALKYNTKNWDIK